METMILILFLALPSIAAYTAADFLFRRSLRKTLRAHRSRARHYKLLHRLTGENLYAELMQSAQADARLIELKLMK